jgi:hypothetical protein
MHRSDTGLTADDEWPQFGDCLGSEAGLAGDFSEPDAGLAEVQHRRVVGISSVGDTQDVVAGSTGHRHDVGKAALPELEGGDVRLVVAEELAKFGRVEAVHAAIEARERAVSSTSASNRQAVGVKAIGPDTPAAPWHAQVRDGLTAVGEHHRQVGGDPAGPTNSRAAAARSRPGRPSHRRGCLRAAGKDLR